MKRDYYPPAMGALISAFLGIACFLLLMFTSMSWFNMLLYAYLLFFALAVILGGYSLTIKSNKLGWAGLAIGSLFIILFFIIVYLFRDICVIC